MILKLLTCVKNKNFPVNSYLKRAVTCNNNIMLKIS